MTSDNTTPLHSPVYLITGASGAIGSEIAAQAAASGARVVVHGSQPESAAAAAEQLRARIPQAVCHPVDADFQQEGATGALVNAAATHWGRLDALVHCAITGAPGVTGLFANTDPAAYGHHAALVLGIFQQLCHHALPHLSRRAGAIVGFTSDAGRFAAPRQALIGGANGGLISFIRNLALEVAREGVRVNAISPGFVEDTPAFDKYGAGGRGETARKRAGLGLPQVADIAPLALFLCGPGARRITGQVISINGGMNA